MALPIKDTPVLTGKDAKKFIDKMNNPGSVSKEEYKRAEEVYNKIKAKEIIELWGALKVDLKPSRIICSECGKAISVESKEPPCIHLKEMFKDIL